MNDKIDTDDLTEKIIGQLERNSADIPPSLAARLRESRLNALELGGRPSLLGFPRWITLSGLATTAILVIAFSLWIRTPKTATEAVHPDDLEVLTSPDKIELYRDLDFYRWLAGGEMTVKAVTLTLSILFISSAAGAASPPADMDLLEFLGDFVTAGGKPVDPVQFNAEKSESRRSEEGYPKGEQKKGKSDRKDKEDESTRHR